MGTHKELQGQIRFQLSQLRARNAHHDFEELTRHFSRLKICDRVIPATGPVGAGGDQGRDFETFKSHLKNLEIGEKINLGIVGDKKLVFTCSLQQKIVQKIKTDITTICFGNDKPDAIYYFCEVALEVAKRHSLQDWCKENYGCDLEILDGLALAEQLCDEDVFWIAQEYLNIPSNLFPRIRDKSKSYRKYKNTWLKENQTPYSFSDFVQIKWGLRRACFNKKTKPDLILWIEKMRDFLHEETPKDLKLMVKYEICVASLRGVKNLQKEQDLVHEYFCELKKLYTPSQFRDARILLSYISSAYLFGHFDIEPRKLFKWSKLLIGLVEKFLKKTQDPGAKCTLLETRGHCEFLQFKQGEKPHLELGDIFFWWRKLLKVVPDAPLYPLEDFADILTSLAKFCGSNNEYQKTTKKVDELLSTRTGGFVAAEKCLDRAKIFIDQKNYIRAIKELHEARLKWFSAETLHETLSAMLYIGHCYFDLGLFYAAEYFFLGVAFVATYHDDENVKPLLPRAMVMAFQSILISGRTITAFNFFELVISSQIQYEEDPLVLKKHQDLEDSIYNLITALNLANRYNPSLYKLCVDLLENLSLPGQIKKEIIECSKQEEFLDKIDDKKIWENFNRDFSDFPFSDVDTSRCIRWKALGITWNISFENKFTECAVGQEVAATIQIIICDMADLDFCLLPTNVNINIETSDILDLAIEPIASNDYVGWKVLVPKTWIENKETVEKFRIKILTSCFVIMRSISLLSEVDFKDNVEKIINGALPLKTFNVASYTMLFCSFFIRERFETYNKKGIKPLGTDQNFKIKEAKNLKWRDDLGPTYSKEKAQKFLKNRYEQGIKSIRKSLPRWKKDKHFKKQIRKLKQEGLLDWEILIIIGNVVLNHRSNLVYDPNSEMKAELKKATAIMFQEEADDAQPIPASIFTDETIINIRTAVLGSVLKTWDLDNHLMTPNFKALEKFLIKRYKHRTDDIPHESLFDDI